MLAAVGVAAALLLATAQAAAGHDGFLQAVGRPLGGSAQVAGSPRRALPLRHLTPAPAPFGDLAPFQRLVLADATPQPAISFPGLTSQGAIPPDPNLAVGPTQIVDITNDGFAVYTKDGLELTSGTLPSIWSALGGYCATRADGDPIVLYDQVADRWVVSQMAAPGEGHGGYWECVAVSVTDDATGDYRQFAWRLSTNTLEDYPKLAAFGSSYFLTTIEFLHETDFSGIGVFALDRAAMLSASDTPRAPVYQDATPFTSDPLLPANVADVVGTDPTEDEYLVSSSDDADELVVLRMHVDWAHPTAAALVPDPATPSIAVPAFDSGVCAPDYVCLHQPGTTKRLDSISDRLMWSLPYRRFADHVAIVANQTVDVDHHDHAGIRWYELDHPLPGTGGLVLAQSGTWAPDAAGRWMGSIGINGNGDIALGYSTSSTTIAPSIRYAGRVATDPPNDLRPEVTAVSGAGAQTAHTRYAERWGDYSGMVVDPADDCTFWYTSEFLTRDDAAAATQIVAFRFPGCAGPGGADTTAPTNPRTVGSDHRSHAWSGKRRVTFRWPGAADQQSGVAGYAVVVDHHRGTLPPPVVSATGQSTRRTLANGTWYVHVRSVDAAGNWSASAVTGGPYFIDTRCTIGGTDGRDTLIGTNRDDVICGLAGNDTIVGGKGNDRILAGPGNDTIRADDGQRDTIDGGTGSDTVRADRIDRVLRSEHVRRA